MEKDSSMVSIVYYTANTEDEAFEQKVKDNILANSNGLPILSVSRKPIDFGRNICIGEQPVCYANSVRQLWTGLKAADTEFVLAAESDVFYPPEYFTFVPPMNDHVYRYSNVWVYFTWPSKKFHDRFWQKSFTEGAQMCNRERWIKAIEDILNPDDWQNISLPSLVFRGGTQYNWTSDNPVITCKTPHNISRYTTRMFVSVDELPYWGKVEDFKRRLA